MTPPVLPLQQSPQYARTLRALGLPVRCGDRAGLLWMTQRRRLPLLGDVGLISRGPVTSTALPADWLALCRDGHRGPLLINADGPTPDRLRADGFWPLLTPATLARLPLSTEGEMRAAMHGKWRNRLNRSADHRLQIHHQPLTPDHWLLDAEAKQSRRKRYRTLPPALIAAFARANPGAALIWEARHQGRPVAAIAVLRHGPTATWQMGVSHPDGRRLCAMNALLWAAMRWLARQGHTTLDLGVLNSDAGPGLTRFKLGTGARPHRLGGTWLHHPALAPLARHLPARLSR
ncbi:GNAT family N-acetyltransferase [Salipiger bermudensis]|uniref:GNAT family N-acetyltransferase n=1 Tax=Salipiger bermudensis TaxID=344736 RepID=UPI001CD74E2C|nr:GNAT family N-acetyltransferase [Salipiger bermudensis]MCA0960651.1 GNAT family N-acetyltransferase [Salipiger bermudensis]